MRARTHISLEYIYYWSSIHLFSVDHLLSYDSAPGKAHSLIFLSLSSHRLPGALCLGMGHCEISPVHIGILTAVVLCRRPHCRHHGPRVAGIFRRYCIAADILVHWLSSVFCFFCDISCVNCRAVLEIISWGWAPQNHPLSKFWPFADLCNSLHLLQTAASLLSGKSCAIYGYKR